MQGVQALALTEDYLWPRRANICSIVHQDGLVATGMHTWRHGSARPLPAGGSPRRGTALPADERRVLLPLRAHRTLGTHAAADAGIPLVSRGHLGPALARDRGGRAGLDP